MRFIAMWILIVLIALYVIAAVTYTTYFGFVVKRYGIAPPPAEIKALNDDFKNSRGALDITGFAPDKISDKSQTFKKHYETVEGGWELTVEYENAELIAFQARLHHNKSRLLNATLEQWTRWPKIISIEGQP